MRDTCSQWATLKRSARGHKEMMWRLPGLLQGAQALPRPVSCIEVFHGSLEAHP